MRTWLFDLRYSLRSLAARPATTALAVAILALGLGATIAVFSVVDALLLRPLPMPQPDRLVRLYQARPSRDLDRGSLSRLDAEDWASRSRTLTGLGLYGMLPSGLTLVGADEPAEIPTAYVSGGFFATLAVRPELGRTLSAEDERGDDRVVVLSHGAWQRRFGGRPDVVGSTLTLDGAPFTVVGVMPPSFRFPEPDIEAWALLTLIPPDSIPRKRYVRWLSAVGRLEPGVDPQTAQAELSGIARDLAREYPDSNAGFEAATVVPLREQMVAAVRPALVALLAAVGLVLLVACANVANLLLARGIARQRSLAILSALGASRLRVVRQLLAESALLVLAGGVAGCLAASWALNALLALAGDILPRAAEIAIDGPVLAFGLAACVATGLLCGLVPAVRLSRTDLVGGLREQGAGAGHGRSQGRVRSTLVAAEVALAVALVIGAGLVIKSLWRLTRVDPGFDPADLLAVNLTLPDYKHPEGRGYQAAYHAMMERVASLPGVESVASIKDLSFERSGELIPFAIDGQPKPAPGQEPQADLYPVSPGFFRTLGIPLLAGRPISAEDRGDAPPVVVVNQALARRYFGGENPVGRRLLAGTTPIEIVGLAGDVRHGSLTEPARPAAYFSQEQVPRIVFTLVVRSARDPLLLAAAVRRAIREVDPDQPITRIASVRDLVAEAQVPSRFFTLLFSLFAGLALALAAFGVYGVLSFEVRQRRREIGVRMAIGAGRREVVAMVLRQGLGVAVVGAALGLGSAFGLSRLLDRLLFQVSATDPLVFAVVPLLLLGVAAMACYLPGRRAARVDPVEALRQD